MGCVWFGLQGPWRLATIHTGSRAAQSEEEAAAAAKERDAALPSDADTDDRDDDGTPPDSGPRDLHHALLLHEAAAIVNLHALAVAVQNIRSLIPVVLDVSGNYARWKDQFLLVVGKFSLRDHVLSDAPLAATQPDWARMDCVVKSWILGSNSDDPADTISVGAISTRDAWLAVETQFLGNRETRALYLDAEFRGFSQGDLSITDYCRHLQQMVTDLGALSEVVSDRTLVLNLIRGLNERYANIGLHLRRSQPFPSFLEAKEALRLEELTLAHQAATPTALVATQAVASSPSGGTGNSKGGGGGSGSGGAQAKPSKSRRSKRGGGNKKDTGASSQHPSGGAKGGQQPGTWPTFWNPWIGSIQMWPGNRPPSSAPSTAGAAVAGATCLPAGPADRASTAASDGSTDSQHCLLRPVASAPPSFWVEALSTATHLLNLLPTKTLDSAAPHLVLFGTAPTYDHLRVFGCTCYPNLSTTAPHKLA
ncbi:uncharacterized protein LOC120689272 [Panicum virgatum]|uniref:uncharacterized protein LOC120689272 n=1 Tax=Panicum virgatum TaxID=38727 RepID=UPI0019D5FB8B|nr:uncharacterized protein LOC120689272 [Panicum virgatum]